jgi:pimeloyl-ACP methyl ester carboxylesterase
MASLKLPREVFITANGVRLRALDWGGPSDAPLLLMLHGVGGNALSFAALGPRLGAMLGDSYHILAIDQRGNGDSDKPPTGYRPQDVAGDVIGVQDVFGGVPMVLAGHSRGGWMAAYVAGRWPERISHLVLVDPARVMFASSQEADEFYDPVRGGIGPFRSREAAIAFARQRDPNARWTPERERFFLFGLEERADGMLIGKMTPSVMDQLRQAREESDSVGPLLHRVTMPVLLLVATKATSERQEQKLEYARRLPQARVERLDGTHYLHFDDPDRVASLIVSFVAGDQPVSSL